MSHTAKTIKVSVSHDKSLTSHAPSLYIYIFFRVFVWRSWCQIDRLVFRSWCIINFAPPQKKQQVTAQVTLQKENDTLWWVSLISYTVKASAKRTRHSSHTAGHPMYVSTRDPPTGFEYSSRDSQGVSSKAIHPIWWWRLWLCVSVWIFASGAFWWSVCL